METKRKSGRPTKDGATNLKVARVMLTQEQIDKAIELGKGIMAVGVRKAIDEYGRNDNVTLSLLLS